MSVAAGEQVSVPRLVETHISTLFFVDGLVYKRKKAVDLGFADFRSLDSRRAACLEEVRLNARLSPDVYLGVAEVRDVDGAPCDHLVVMRQLPDSARLAKLVTDGQDVKSVLEDVAKQVAALHRRGETSMTQRRRAGPDDLEQLWRRSIDAVHDFPHIVPLSITDRTRTLALAWLAGRRALVSARQAAAVDGHGDLLADDIFSMPDGARILDCLEFDERLRIGDPIADAAFLVMDLERLHSPEAAATFLRAFLEQSNDRVPAGLIDHYLAYRAHIRCKVACLRAAQGEPPGGLSPALALAELALAHLERARVRLLLLGGLPGTGKTTLASSLAPQHGWLHLSSDTLRKTASPDATTVRFGTGRHYSQAARAEIYASLFAQAQQALDLGQSVVVDASFWSAELRERAREVATRSGADVVEVNCAVDARTADTRLQQRPKGPSDATPDIRAALSLQTDPWPEATMLDTSGSVPESLYELDRISCPRGHPETLAKLP